MFRGLAASSCTLHSFCILESELFEVFVSASSSTLLTRQSNTLVLDQAPHWKPSVCCRHTSCKACTMFSMCYTAQWQIVPALVGGEDVFGGSPVRKAACGDKHTLILSDEGVLRSCGEGENGALGLNDMKDWWVPTQVKALHFGDTKIVSTAAECLHSAAVTEHGALYTWGQE